MGVRESLNNQNPKVVVGVTAVIVLVAVAVLMFSRSSAEGGGDMTVLAFFSSDDGATWFPDDASKLPPFEHNGKQAVRANVFRCPDGKEFVAYLERFTPEAKKQMEAVRTGGQNGADMMMFLADDRAGVEVKAPGSSTWISQSDPRAMTIMTPKCPRGGQPEVVLPTTR